MFIKSIVLEGFKSYGNRVEITGFDPTFNAITGLNGTGKSNILDAICFVLGITNLSNVRAANLQELIYKHGQAGITKATVSITFDNSNKAQQPIGYDSKEITVTRQVVMGGKNKYLINGINVQNKRVSDLFCSVQLNVNNPHFLIMQGRITKVLNMKPPEILSMVEEAAGTRMYEAKKQSAQKTIEKKDAKMREINDIINEDIAPKLQKLQDERSQFQEYQKVVRELENLTKLDVAYKFVRAEEKAQEAEEQVRQIEADIASKQDAIKENEREIKNIDTSIADINRQLDEERGGALRALEEELRRLEGAEARAAAALSGARSAQRSQRQRAELLRRALAQDGELRRERAARLQHAGAEHERLRAAADGAAAALAAAQRRLLGVGGDGAPAADSPRDRLMAAAAAAAEAGTRADAARLELAAALARRDALLGEAREDAAQHESARAAAAELEERLRAAEAELAPLRVDPARPAELAERVRALQAQARRERDEADALAARLQRARPRIPPPPGAPRGCIEGTVCELVEVKDPADYAALETTAGNKLYNLVVDSESTAKLLLQKGYLQTRTTIIPLNKISAQVIDRQTVALAQEIGGGADSAACALELVTYAARVRPAVAWVFGGTLVCRDLATARRVTFHPRVRRRAVTRDGDSCEPGGTLSGGARAPAELLRALAAARLRDAAAAAAERDLAAARAELQAVQRRFDEYHARAQRRDVLDHELDVLRARAADTAHAHRQRELDALQRQIDELTEAIARDEALRDESAALVARLEAEVADIRGHRDREHREAEKALAQARREADKHEGSRGRRERELEALRLELGELERAEAAGRAQLDEAEAAAAAEREAELAAQEAHGAAAAALAEQQERVRAHAAEAAGRDRAAGALAARRAALQEAARRLALEAQAAALAARERGAEGGAARARAEALARAHGWLVAEREFLGAAGGRYDFAARGGAEAGARARALTERRDRLARGLNARAHALLGKEQEQYEDLLRKRRIVEADRAKLVQVMEELDERKRDALVKACERVNRDFGSIFGALLPGASAELRPPAGRSVLEGLEVRVGFSGAWKESLGELSGGQRSLVALALVLAMLLFNPAPLYVLDEVDAALDLSHTQNIGAMLRDHFRHSQFIIVSLKDGMFNNANVLFRTRFVDGMSSVQRTVTARR